MASLLRRTVLVMLRAVTALLAVALIGGPTVKLGCDVWCYRDVSALALDHGAYHGIEIAGHHGPSVAPTRDGCTTSFEARFVPEARQRTPVRTLSATPAFAIVSAPPLNTRTEDGARLSRGDAGPPSRVLTPIRI